MIGQVWGAWNEWADGRIEWCMENMSGCIFAGLLALAVVFGAGFLLFGWHTDPEQARQVGGRRTYVVLVTRGYPAPGTTEERHWVLISTDGHECEVDELTYRVRKDGEMQPCRWRR